MRSLLDQKYPNCQKLFCLTTYDKKEYNQTQIVSKNKTVDKNRAKTVDGITNFIPTYLYLIWPKCYHSFNCNAKNNNILWEVNKS